MQRRFRLQHSGDIQRVRRSGRSYAHPLVVLIASPNGLDSHRIAFSTSRAVGSAVVRNTIRRRMREVVRGVWATLPDGWDFVMVARTRSAHARFEELARAIRSLFRQAERNHVVPRDPGRTR